MGDVAPGRRWVKWVVLTGAFLLVAAGCYFALQPAGPHEYSPEDIQLSVIDTCQAAAKKGLKDPDSARFDGWEASNIGGGQYKASGTVNAKNGFGGYSGPEHYMCDAEVVGGNASGHDDGPVGGNR